MKRDLKDLVSVFLKLGTIGFGGPAAHIAMMEEEVVAKRQWMSREHFLDLVGATNLIPGPNSTEMAMHCGYQKAGGLGLLVAGICFVFPATVISALLGWIYLHYGRLPEIKPYVYGIQPAVLGIIFGAVWGLGRKALKNIELGVLGILVLIAAFLGANEIVVLLGAGVLGAFYLRLKSRIGTAKLYSLSPWISLPPLGAWFTTFPAMKFFGIFLKVGAVLYGSGYVLFALLDAELVANGYLTRPQLIDAIAVGQLTPGPVLSTATFIGYQLSGLSGAILATVGIFLPSFLFVWILNPLVPRMRRSILLSNFLDSVNIASVALIGFVLLKMSLETLTQWRMIAIAVSSVVVTLWLKKTNALWLVIGGALTGYFLTMI